MPIKHKRKTVKTPLYLAWLMLLILVMTLPALFYFSPNSLTAAVISIAPAEQDQSADGISIIPAEPDSSADEISITPTGQNLSAENISATPLEQNISGTAISVQPIEADNYPEDNGASADLETASSKDSSNNYYLFGPTPPQIKSVTLNSTNPANNNTYQNLTANVSYSDIAHPVRFIYNWLVNNQSITVLNMPFENINNTGINNSYDYSGFGINANDYSCATWRGNGGYNNTGAYNFSGAPFVSGCYISGNGLPIVDTNQSLTLTIWFNATANAGAGAGATIFEQGWSDCESYSLFISSTGEIVFLNNNGSSGFSLSPTIDISQWVHFALVMNRSGTYGYKNGVYAGSTSGSAQGTSYCPYSNWTIGADSDAPGFMTSFFNGTIDELVIWNRSLSAQQINALYEINDLYSNRTDLIVSQETSLGENWSVDVTGNDAQMNGNTNRSNTVLILNSKPTQSTPKLNSTNPATNDTNQNLTAYNISTADLDGEYVKNIYNWLVNNQSITLLNLPFEKVNGTDTNNALDYSGTGINVTDYINANWNASGGYDLRGAYYLNDSYIKGYGLSNPGTNGSMSITLWVKPTGISSSGSTLFSKGLFPTCTGYGLSFDTARIPYIANNLGPGDYIGTTSLAMGAWNHLAYVFNSSGVTAYINGSYVGTDDYGTSDCAASNFSFGIYMPNLVQNYFNGTIDEFVIWNRSLTVQQINALYKNRTDLIVSQETTIGENWSVDLTPNDGYEDGQALRSNPVTILNAKPTQSTPKLNSTNPATNDTNQNLTAYAQGTADIDNNAVKNIFNWKVNNQSIAVLNMPFEQINSTTSNNAWDYSGYGNNGSESGGAVWNATGGYDGKGAYEFDRVANKYINIPSSSSLGDYAGKNITFSAWIKPYHQGADYGTVICLGSWNLWMPILSSPTLLSFGIYNGASWNYLSNYGALTEGIWQHVAISTYILSNGSRVIRHYVNGIDVGGGISSTQGETATAGVQIGSMSVFANYKFNGTIDDVMIFNRSLSAEQVLALYNNRTDLIVANETLKGENWSVDITPNDGYDDGQTLRSNPVTILNTKPTQSTPKLNSTNPATNDTNQNLTAYAQGTADIDNDSVKNIYNWLVNNQSIAVLNMPFEKINNTGGANGNAWDYSGYMNNGSENGSMTWNDTGGYDSKGAYMFNGKTDYILIQKTTKKNTAVSVFTWMYQPNISREFCGGGEQRCTLVSTLWDYLETFDGEVHVYGEQWNTPGWFSVAGVINSGQWYHVGYTYNKVNTTDSNITIYVNGVNVATETSTAKSGTMNYIGTTCIGGHYINGRYFNGTIDDVMIFNRSLTSAQVLALYNNRTDLIVSQETNISENWSMDLTPNDGYEDGQTLRSNPVRILDIDAPTFSNPSNTSSNFRRYQNFTANITISNFELDAYKFSSNANGSSWFNLTRDISGASYSASEQLNISWPVDTQVCWYYWANDSSNNAANSSTYCFNVVNTPPTQATPILNSTNTATNDTNQNLTAYNQSTFDIDDKNVTNIYNWLVNNKSIAVLNMPFERINSTGGVHGNAGNAWDYSGYGNNGTISLASWNSTGGYDGRGAYRFDSTDYIQLDDNIGAQIAGSRPSFSIWIRAEKLNNLYPAAIGIGENLNRQLWFWFASAGTARIFECENSSGTDAVASYTTDFTIGQWYHYAGTFNATDMLLYENGIFKTSTPFIGGLTAGSTSNFIGYANGAHSFNGTIDDVRIFNYSISAEQILALYNNRTDLIVANETIKGENWSVDVTPNDGYEDGQTLRSNPVTILNTKPTQSTPKLNSTNPATNDTNQNLTAYVQGTADVDNDSVKNIYNWLVNNLSITLLNLPFERVNETDTSNAFDYSSLMVNVTDYIKTVWNTSGGYDLRGAYHLNGSSIKGNGLPNPGTNGSLTITMWIKPNVYGTDNSVIFNQGLTFGSGSCFAEGIYVQSAGFLRAQNRNTTLIAISTFPLSTNRWYHLAIVFNASGTYGYINGTFDRATTGYGTTYCQHSNFSIGSGSADSTVNNFNGTIDELIIWNRSLSAQQINDLYNNRTDLIVSQETNKSENWSVDITPNDGYEDGQTLRSNPVTILNTRPTQTTPKLNSTNPATNDTNQNLTAYAQGTADVDSDSVKNIYNWLVNNQSITVLNMPFEEINSTTSNNALDYSGFGHSGTETNSPVWNATGGHDGKGAYMFDGLTGGSFIFIADSTPLRLYNGTMAAWIKTANAGVSYRGIVTKFGTYEMYLADNIFGIYDNSAPAFRSTGVNLADNNWHFVAVTFQSGISGGTKLYIDGISNTTTDETHTVMTNDLVIGTGQSSVTQVFNGTIDDVMIFNRSLSAEQILALYNNRTDLIVANETVNKENWSVDVTPNDGYEDGPTLRSNPVLILDVDAPTFSNPSNTSSNFRRYQNFTANITISNFDLDAYKFSSNGNGSNWFNLTRDISGATYYANESLNISWPVDTQVCWYYWANDTSNNAANSSTYCFNVVNTLPTQATPKLNSTAPATNDTNQNLTAWNQSTFDLDDKNVTNIYNWLVNNKSITVLNMPFERINSTNTSNAWDYSGYGNNGTESGSPVWNATGGHDGKGAYQFDGINDYINLGTDIPALKPTIFSIEAWVYLKSETTTSYQGIVDGTNTAGAQGYILLYHNAADAFYLYVDQGNNDWKIANSAIGVYLNSWHHLVGTFNGTILKVYLDGVLQPATDTAAQITYGGTGRPQIGRYSTTEYFNGTIDEVRIWNRSLSAEEINALYMNRTDLIVANETTKGENWSVDITPNDGSDDGQTLRSNPVTILNTKPTQSTPKLNSTDLATNDTNQNLTAYVQGTADIDSDSVKNVYNWLVNNQSIAVLNMPFERINNTKTSNAWDYSGFGNNGTESGSPVWNSTGGYDGKGAYQFDGVDDYINIANTTSIMNTFETNKNFSMSFWFYPTSNTTAGGWAWVVSKAYFNHTSPYYQFDVRYFNERYIQANVWRSDTLSVYLTTQTAGDVYLNNWYYITITVDLANNILKLYLNGALVSTDDTTTGGTYSNWPTNLTLGGNQNLISSAYNFNGTMDEVMIFNRTLSPEQINALYMNRTDLIVANETIHWENWSVDVTPNDGYEDGQTIRSNPVTILNTRPTQTTPILNSTNSATNDTNQNLTAYAQGTADIDNDSVKNIYNWLVNNKSIAVLNMPFERINSTDTNNAWDYSGFSKNGSESGSPVWNATSGYDGKGAYKFNSNNYIKIPDSGSNDPLDVQDNLTLAVWIYPTADTASAYIIMKPWVANVAPWRIYSLVRNGATQTYFSVVNTSNTAQHVYTSGSIPLNTWTHVAGTYDGQYFKIYINGNLINTTNVSGKIQVNNRDVYISYNPNWAAQSFSGKVDEIYIFNRTLSAEQINALYMNRTDLIVANETVNKENWSVDVTPNDGYEDGQTLRSNPVLILDIDAPTFSNPSNTSSNFRRYQNFTANITISNFELDAYKFSSNGNGSWFNLSRDISGAQYSASEQLNVSWPVDTQICWYYWANDTSGNAANSSTYCFNVVNTPPTQATPKLNSTNPATNDTNQNLTAYNQSTFDLDDKNVTNIYNWLVNNKSIAVLNMPFEQINNTGGVNGNAWDYSSYMSNGTNNGSKTVWNATGGYNKKGAYEFNGIDNYIVTNGSALNPESITISAWVKTNLIGDFQYIFAKEAIDQSLQYYLRITNTGTVACYLKISNEVSHTITTTATVSAGSWNHIACTYDSVSGLAVIYFNGTSVKETDFDNNQALNSTVAYPFVIGRNILSNANGYYFNGTIDEVMIFNRSLSAEQINALYSNRTDLIVANEIVKGENWSVDLTPNDGYEDGQTLRSNPVNILNTAPAFNSSIPNQTAYTNQSFSLLLNCSDIDSDTISYYDNTTLFEVNASTGQLNDSPSEWEQGTYSIAANCSDGETNTTITFNYTIVDATVPRVNISNPANQSNLSGTYNFNATINDTSTISNVFFQFSNGTNGKAFNETATNNSGVWNAAVNTNKAMDGSHIVTVFANDSLGNMNSTEWINITIDNTVPVVTLIAPINYSGSNTGNITFNYNVTDNSGIANCSLLIERIVNQTNITVARSTTQNFSLTDLIVSQYNWSINCTDSVGNSNASEMRSVSVIMTTEFSGLTTDLSQVNVFNITNLIIDQPNYGMINFTESVNLTPGADINANVNISFNRIEVNSANLTDLNKAARLTLYNLTFSNPQALKDGAVCADCIEISYSNIGTFIFTVTGFSVYSAGETPVAGGTGTPGTSTSAGGGGGKEAEEVLEKCTESWLCSDWSPCSEGHKSRTCYDEKGCGTDFYRPVESKECVTYIPAAIEKLEEIPEIVQEEFARPEADLWQASWRSGKRIFWNFFAYWAGLLIVTNLLIVSYYLRKGPVENYLKKHPISLRVKVKDTILRTPELKEKKVQKLGLWGKKSYLDLKSELEQIDERLKKKFVLPLKAKPSEAEPGRSKKEIKEPLPESPESKKLLKVHSLEELESWVHQMLALKVSEPRVRKLTRDLTSFPESLISQALCRARARTELEKKYRLTEKKFREIKDFISKRAGKGISKEAIISQLVEEGWSQAVIGPFVIAYYQ